MTHTVGIVGVNGNVGAATAKLLVQAADNGSIMLIVYHRKESAPKSLDLGKNAEFRILDFEDSKEKIQEAIKGVNVFISAVGFSALPNEPKLVEVLANSPDLVTYIPSSYSTTWSDDDFKQPELGEVLKFIYQGWQRARELNVGVTLFSTGAFDLYWFDLGFVGAPIKGNTIWANSKQLQHSMPITTMSHLASAITQVATAAPQSIKDRNYSVVTFMPTGQELLDLYSKLNGSLAQIKDFTKADREAFQADGPSFGPAKVGYWDRWDSNDWRYELDGRIAIPCTSGEVLEEVARKYI